MKERFSRYSIQPVDTSGFENLDVNEQHILYYLSMSGLVARDLRFIQTSRWSLPVKEFLEALLDLDGLDRDILASASEDYRVVCVNGGIYHESKGDRFIPELTKEQFNRYVDVVMKTLPKETVDLAFDGLFSAHVPPIMTPEDPNEVPGFNVAEAGITNAERKDVIDTVMAKNKGSNRPPMSALNMFLMRDKENNVVVDRASVSARFADGKVGAILSRSCGYLRKALSYCHNKPKLKATLTTLIEFYETGDPEDFDKHCLAWMEHAEDGLYFVHGFIETYDDPMKKLGSFEAMVGFEDKEESERIRKLIGMSQYLEDNLPVDGKFKRERATGIKGSSTRLVSFAGSAAPVVPLGNCLPNSNWIKTQIGSSSTNFGNIVEARGILSKDLCSRFIAPVHQNGVMKYLREGTFLMINLHECAGHASGKLLAGVSEDALGEYYPVIEEARADLVAYYYLADPKIVQAIYPHIDNVEEFAKAMYVDYLTNGVLRQLQRMPKGSTSLGAAHFKNRQLNNLWVLEKGLKNNAVRWKRTPSGMCLEVIDVYGIRDAYGELLREVQDIKSTGNKAKAKNLVESYGTKIDQKMLDDAHSRVEDLDLESFDGFYTPQFVATDDKNAPYRLTCSEDFIDDQRKLTQLSKLL
jgi:dipeptidyl-peptidase-3